MYVRWENVSMAKRRSSTTSKARSAALNRKTTWPGTGATEPEAAEPEVGASILRLASESP